MWRDKTTVPLPQDWDREGGLCGKGVANKALPAPPLLARLRSRREPRAWGATRVPVRWGRGLGSFGGLGNNAERLGVGEEQVRRNSTGDGGDYVRDPVRRGTKRARDAPEMSAGGFPRRQRGTGRACERQRRATSRPRIGPLCRSHAPCCQLRGHAVRVGALDTGPVRGRTSWGPRVWDALDARAWTGERGNTGHAGRLCSRRGEPGSAKPPLSRVPRAPSVSAAASRLSPHSPTCPPPPAYSSWRGGVCRALAVTLAQWPACSWCSRTTSRPSAKAVAAE